LKTPDTWTDAEEEVEAKPKDKEVCEVCGKTTV
jgi:ribosomal protein L37AE/L43A